MITLGAIVRYERLTRKPFLSLSTEDEAMALMYVCNEKNRRYTLDTFRRAAAGSQEFAEFVRGIGWEIAYSAQYARGAEEEQAGEPQPLAPTIMALLFAGVDAGWLMSQGVEMIEPLVDGYERRERAAAESNRFWQLFQIGPHVTQKDYNRIRVSLKFPWERTGLRLTDKQESALAKAVFNKTITF